MSQNIKSVLILLGVVIILVGAIAFAKPGMDQSKKIEDVKTETLLGVDRTNHDFGTISMKDGKVKTSFNVTNTTTTAVNIDTLFTSCMCTEATLKIKDKMVGPFGMQGHGFMPGIKEVINPGEEVEIIVEFDPNAHGPAGLGVIERVVTLGGDNTLIAQFNIKANVRP